MRIPSPLFIVYRMFLWLVGTLFGLFFIFFFIMSLGKIDGLSMEPGFVDQEMFIVNKFVYLFKKPQRQDIVQYIDIEYKVLIVKRVIGLPGDKLKYFNKNIYRWEQGSWILIEEPYLAPYSQTVFNDAIDDNDIIEVPQNSYYLLGDNRLFSFDSRQVGFINRSNIVGKIIDLVN